MNRVALITGSSRGLGATLAAFLAGQGFDLILTARGEEELRNTAHALGHYGGKVIEVPGDVTEGAHRDRLVEEAKQLGRLDLLVNNASILGPSPQPPLAGYPLEALTDVFLTNVIASLGLVQAALPLLEKSRGLIVNVSSDAAIGAYPGWGGYGASKAALDLMTATLATELAARGIAAVSVDPGDMRTQLHQDAFPGEDISDRPLPTVTIPFWAWLLGQRPESITGRRYKAQGDRWEAAA